LTWLRESRYRMEEIESIMGQAPEWATELPLHVDGYECEFYKKEYIAIYK
jgi:hypothetical protein